MERKYLLRKNYKSKRNESGQEILGHLAFKTKNALWVGTSLPTLTLISIQSRFHDGREGALKMEAFLSIIRSSIQSPVTALIADTAHLKTRRLIDGDCALSNCFKEAQALILRYEQFFAGYKFLYWHTLEQKEEFSLLQSEILALSKSDVKFRRLLEYDAQNTWTKNRQELYPDQKVFIENSIEDIISQCACLRLLDRLGYRYLFYPGSAYRANLYLNAMMSPQMEWIDVFLTIEKKTIKLKKEIDS